MQSMSIIHCCTMGAEFDSDILIYKRLVDKGGSHKILAYYKYMHHTIYLIYRIYIAEHIITGRDLCTTLNNTYF